MLTKKSENKAVYLEVKHYCLWQALKQAVPGCDTLEVTNPKTSQKITKHGYRFDTVSGHVTKIIKYDTAKQYSTRYFGFKLHLIEAGEEYVLDMPYQGQFLRRFLRIAPNVDFMVPLSITIFKGKKKAGDSEETGVWFRQNNLTVRPYFTREEPHGMPEAVHDPDLDQWDFRTQHRWLIDHLMKSTIPAVEHAAKLRQPPPGVAPPTAPMDHVPVEDEGPPMAEGITDEDVPFRRRPPSGGEQINQDERMLQVREGEGTLGVLSPFEDGRWAPWEMQGVLQVGHRGELCSAP